MTNNNLQNGSTRLTTRGFAMPMIIGIIVLVVIVAGAGVYLLSNNSKNDAAMMEKQKMEQKAMEEKEAMEKKAMKEKDAMMKKDEGAMMKKEGEAMMAKYTGTVLAGKSAPLLNFNKADYDAAVKSDKLVVLYFYANWCPICLLEVPKLKSAFDELTTDKVVGFQVNYNDSQTDNDEKNLAREFGVPYQHTKVFLKNGKQILKAPDSWSKDRYLTEINKAI